MSRWIPDISRKYGRLIPGALLIALLGSPGLPAKQSLPCAAPAGQILPITLPSTTYGKPVAVRIYLPPCYAAGNPPPYPVIYLLHGGGADETQWPDLNVQISADTLITRGAPPFVVVMPGAPYDVDYSAYVIKDLLPGIESRYRVLAVHAGRAIGGLSLGGYWALRIAFLHPDLFAAVGGYSPVVSLGDSSDPLALARRATVPTLQGLQIDLDVGSLDSLAYDTNQLARVLRARGIPVTSTVGLGAHNRLYWRAHAYDYFRFILNTIGPSYKMAPVGTVF